MKPNRNAPGPGPGTLPTEPAAPTPANPSQGSGKGRAEAADPRAVELLLRTRRAQAGLPLQAALAWERAAFAEAFLDEEPRRRVRAFLGEGK
jgi:hypothetical protein